MQLVKKAYCTDSKQEQHCYPALAINGSGRIQSYVLC